MVPYQGPRSIEAHELPELIQLLNLVFRPHGGDMGRDYPRHVALSNRENVRIITVDGKIVSHVSTSIRPLNLGGIPTWEAGIGAVATHPDARGHGFASILMQDAVERSVSQGADIMLISGDMGVYKRMHAVECGQYLQVRITPDIPESQKGYSLRKVQFDDLPAIGRLWETLPVRYLLPLEDWQALFECQFVMDKPSEWWMVMDGDEAVGFGIVHPKDQELLLLDWVGRSDALNTAGAFWFQHYGIQTLTYTVCPNVSIPKSWLSQRQPIRAFDGTVLVIEARRFLQRARAFLAQRIGEEMLTRLQIDAQEQSVRFRFGDEQVTFEHGGEVTLLFFGHPTVDILSTKLAEGSKLRAVLRRMFPIPLVWYGIGYV